MLFPIRALFLLFLLWRPSENRFNPSPMVHSISRKKGELSNSGVIRQRVKRKESKQKWSHNLVSQHSEARPLGRGDELNRFIANITVQRWRMPCSSRPEALQPRGKGMACTQLTQNSRRTEGIINICYNVHCVQSNPLFSPTPLESGSTRGADPEYIITPIERERERERESRAGCGRCIISLVRISGAALPTLPPL